MHLFYVPGIKMLQFLKNILLAALKNTNFTMSA